MPSTRRAALVALAPLALLVLVTGCGPRQEARPRAEPLAEDLRSLLLDPTQDCRLPAASEQVEALAAAHRALLAGGDPAASLAAADGVLGAEPEATAAAILRAQALLVGGRGATAAQELGARRGREPGCLALDSTLARALEAAGDLPAAYASYRDAATRLPAAATRAAELSGRAQEVARSRFDEAMRQRRLEAADAALSELERWWPRTSSTLEARRALAAAQGDAEGELEAVRGLLGFAPGDRGLTLRRGQLELAVGDAREGLELIEGLAAAAPGDPELAEELERAKFRWRLVNAPETVRRIAAKPALNRADLAVLLYWMVPRIRSAKPGTVRIASDILEHPAQSEIARVVNLGLMTIDETLHHFAPDAPLRSSEAVAALLRLMDESGQSSASCWGGTMRGREALCQAGVDCGILTSGDSCRAALTPSGDETVEMLRRALARMESR